MPYTRFHLDKCNSSGESLSGASITKDLTDYVGYRLANSLAIKTNVTAVVNGKLESSSAANQTRFATHLVNLANGSYLFAKLTLDLLESGHLVAKSASYKVRKKIPERKFLTMLDYYINYLVQAFNSFVELNYSTILRFYISKYCYTALVKIYITFLNLSLLDLIISYLQFLLF